jgi:hypothetical protein
MGSLTTSTKTTPTNEAQIERRPTPIVNQNERRPTPIEIEVDPQGPTNNRPPSTFTDYYNADGSWRRSYSDGREITQPAPVKRETLPSTPYHWFGVGAGYNQQIPQNNFGKLWH